MANPPTNPLVEVKSDAVAHAIVRGERSYVDWLPIDLTIKRANSFFSVGHAFGRLESSDKRKLQRLTLIRNAIAHDSAHAMRVFRKELVEGLGLPPAQHRPGGFLRGQHAGPQRRVEFHMTESIAVVRKLCR